MSFSTERIFRVLAIPQKLLGRNDRRYSWDITNVATNTVYYMRGPRGRDMAAAGEAQGVPIAASAADGYDEEDSCDEVWLIGTLGDVIIIGETYLPMPWPEYRMGGSSGRRISGVPRH